MVNLSLFSSKASEAMFWMVKLVCAFLIQGFNLFVLLEEYENTSVFIYSYLNAPPTHTQYISKSYLDKHNPVSCLPTSDPNFPPVPPQLL